jgi:signal transduction histidine kinase/CheY-like chemotaxis protein
MPSALPLLLVALVGAGLAAVAAWRRATERAADVERQRAALQDLVEWQARAEGDALLWCDPLWRVVRHNADAQRLLGDRLRVGRSLVELAGPEGEGAVLAAVAPLTRGEVRRVELPPALGMVSATGPQRVLGRAWRLPGDRPGRYLVLLRALSVAPAPAGGPSVSTPMPVPEDLLTQAAHGIAHEFNNLLTTIAGRTEIALQSVADPAMLSLELQEVRADTERAAQLARRLLTLSSVYPLQPRILAANDVLDSLAPALWALGGGVPVTLRPDDAAGYVNADPERLQRILLLLVENAVEALAGRAAGQVTVSTARARTAPRGLGLPTAPGGDFTVFTVHDDGPGISSVARARLFEPYFSTKPGHRGLGLVTANGMARESGGGLEVRSAPGAGTTVSLWLPRVSAGMESAPPGRLRASRRSVQPTVLVVEDEDSIRRFVRIVLEREGLRVLMASNGIEALRLLEDPALTLDLLLTDVMMPQMGGRELAERLLAVQPDLAVVFMSGYVADRAVLSGVAARRAPLLQKPFAIEDLVRTVRAVLADAPSTT